MSQLSLWIGIVLIFAVNCALALLFYSPEAGFGWFFWFILMTVAILVAIAFAISIVAKREIAKLKSEAPEKALADIEPQL